MAEPGAGTTPFRTSPADYGEDYRGHLLEQYKLLVETADRVSARRATANSYLLSVNTGLIALYGIGASLGFGPAAMVAFCLAGALLSLSWYVLIRSYRALNAAKFKVIHEIETRLPVAAFHSEWQAIQADEGRRYLPLTAIEQYVPLIFLVLYAAFLVYELVA